MTFAFRRGDALLFMKVGTHANEPLEHIIERKKAEIVATGYAMWGYGGNTCHPGRVRSYADSHDKAGHVVRLCMQPMNSNHMADQIRADEYSTDGTRWVTIPEPINVLGSRYALCIDGLEEVDENISLSNTVVAIGNSRGKQGSEYIQGRVDKACLEVVNDPTVPGDVPIRLVAKLVSPYAVLLRNQPRAADLDEH